jgi:hypothetical protein
MILWASKLVCLYANSIIIFIHWLYWGLFFKVEPTDAYAHYEFSIISSLVSMSVDPKCFISISLDTELFSYFSSMSKIQMLRVLMKAFLKNYTYEQDSWLTMVDTFPLHVILTITPQINMHGFHLFVWKTVNSLSLFPFISDQNLK